MTAAAADAFLDRLETDEDLVKELLGLHHDPAAALARVRAAGFDVSREELREAALERYSGQLTADQLDSIAAGYDVAAGLADLQSQIDAYYAAATT